MKKYKKRFKLFTWIMSKWGRITGSMDRAMIQSRTSSSQILYLKPGEVFVFGSNKAGRHGGGAAQFAFRKLDAIWGKGFGRVSKKTYAIPTKGWNLEVLGLDEIQTYVDQFIAYAMMEKNFYTTFLVTEIGCGLAGYTPEQIAPMFEDAVNVPNIHLPKSFWKILRP